MPKVLRNLVKKEVLDLLRDPKILVGMIIIPAALYPVMGAAMKASMSAAGKAALQLPVAILDLDGSPESEIIVSTLSQSGKVVILSVSEDKALEKAQELKAGALVVIPEGFGELLESGQRTPIEVHVFFERSGFSIMMFSGRLEEALKTASSMLSAYLVSLTSNLSPEAILNPVELNYSSMFRGKVLNVPPQALAGTLSGQMTTTPVVAMLVIIFAMQIAATSLAIEKEEKTLETLLTLPVSRRNILIAKLAGSAVVAGIGSLSVLGGLWYYLRIMGSTYDAQPLRGLVSVTAEDLALLAIALMAANMLALTLAIILSVFAEDVRSAQALVGNLYILIFIPAFMLMFTDIETLPTVLQYALKAIPFTHLALASQSITWGEYSKYALSVLYLLLWSTVLMALASKIFSSEKILTARIKFGRRVKR